ncbi:hypothetical protein SAMN04489716_6979 [Actinoplanes derwentensis]|uniref:Uncharacterized protein n=1 Tax=Actinoplanes derwentensis TaxID=113562 RepID=A0A1H2CVT4_9ACTN|nr:hypothetical protein Ade03nite_09600 [Actinoplanes derwentensis]SDT74429.1 hypothetical protein SAMN04489716_6979 [Actinoplanes derwentensis]
MIGRWHGNDFLIDQEAAAVIDARGLSKHTVRTRLAGFATACDVATRAPLYDHEEAAHILGTVRPRPARRATAQRAQRVGP